MVARIVGCARGGGPTGIGAVLDAYSRPGNALEPGSNETMKLITAMLADHADAVNGKLYVTGGGWNQVVVAQLPASHNHLSLALAIEVGWEETNEPHMLGIRFLDESDEQVGPTLGGELKAGRPPALAEGQAQNVALVYQLNGLPIRTVGPYRFEVTIDGSTLAELPLHVVVRPRRTPPTSPTPPEA